MCVCVYVCVCVYCIFIYILHTYIHIIYLHRFTSAHLKYMPTNPCSLSRASVRALSLSLSLSLSQAKTFSLSDLALLILPLPLPLLLSLHLIPTTFCVSSAPRTPTSPTLRSARKPCFRFASSALNWDTNPTAMRGRPAPKSVSVSVSVCVSLCRSSPRALCLSWTISTHILVAERLKETATYSSGDTWFWLV